MVVATDGAMSLRTCGTFHTHVKLLCILKTICKYFKALIYLVARYALAHGATLSERQSGSVPELALIRSVIRQST